MTAKKGDPIRIFLAEDDEDDREFFEDALKHLNIETELTISRDGQELMSSLDDKVPPVPYAIFLDLNMPRKNGFECLEEIKQNDKLKEIPIIIFSTSDDEGAIHKTYTLGANFYIRKPRSFELLIKAIHTVLTVDLTNGGTRTSKDKFFLAIA